MMKAKLPLLKYGEEISYPESLAIWINLVLIYVNYVITFGHWFCHVFQDLGTDTEAWNCVQEYIKTKGGSI